MEDDRRGLLRSSFSNVLHPFCSANVCSPAACTGYPSCSTSLRFGFISDVSKLALRFSA